MRCRDAKDWLTAQRENDLVQSEVTALQEHLKQCSACHTYEQYHQRTDPVLNSPTSRMFTSISTERIMQAVERQKRITEQLEDLRTQQRTRIARLRIFTPRFATLTYLSMGLISLLLLALLIFNTDIVVNVLESFGGVIDTLVVACTVSSIRISTCSPSGVALVSNGACSSNYDGNVASLNASSTGSIKAKVMDARVSMMGSSSMQKGKRFNWLLLVLVGPLLFIGFKISGIGANLAWTLPSAQATDKSVNGNGITCTRNIHGPSFRENIVIGSNEVVCGDITSFGGSVTVQGALHGNITAFNSNTVIIGQIFGNLTVFGGAIATK